MAASHSIPTASHSVMTVIVMVVVMTYSPSCWTLQQKSRMVNLLTLLILLTLLTLLTLLNL
jgi:hypothetical protein